MSRRLFYPALAFLIVALVPAMAAEKGDAASQSVHSDEALAYLKFDIENNPGWVATVKGGYQWKLFRGVGYTINDSGLGYHSKSGNHTKSGAAASVGLGYNFGQWVPITLGLRLGVGPSGNFNTRSVFTSGGDTWSMFARQKIRTFDFDANIDYDFKNCSRWTPFVGLVAGLTFTSNRAKATLSDGTTDYFGRYGKKRKTNFMGGFRAGTKYEINERVILSLDGSYAYIGNISARNLNMTDGAGGSVDVRTRKVKAHELEVKAGIKILF